MNLLPKIMLDGILALVFIVALGFHATGGMLHELAGLFWCILVGVHCWWNRHWFFTVFKGKYSFRRAVSNIVILFLALGLVTIAVTGLMNSGYVLGFMELGGNFEAKRIHTIASYWSLVLVGIHAGMHWRAVTRAVPFTPSAASRGGLRVAALLLFVTGIWASFDREIGTKLFEGAAFDFWNPERPPVLFFLANFAILGVYAIAAHSVFSFVIG
ncbi:MAG: hypothetical protein DELT_01309 [Desulfovibrio sp.]